MNRVKSCLRPYFSWLEPIRSHWRRINPDIRIVLTTAIVALIAGLAIKNQTDPFEWANFRLDVLVTLFSLIFGIPIALGISRYQENRTRQEKVKKMLPLIRDELQANKNVLNSWTNNLADGAGILTIGIVATSLEDSLWKVFSDGGELEWIDDVNLLFILAYPYSTIQSIKNAALNYLSYVESSPPNERQTASEEVSSLFADQLENLDTYIEATIKHIDKLLGDNYL